ncbi:MAG: IPT/TIG domain-containing protein [Acidobacteria bacterium]|nr:IPT/TIG domain-containing protein [Acidobacteriota bacterium]
MPRTTAWIFAFLLPIAGAHAQTSLLKATPASVSFTYQIGAALPVSQTLAVSSAVAGLAFNAVAVSTPAWLSVSPDSGKTPLSLKVGANPSTLSAATYSGKITLTPTSGSNFTALDIPVQLVVKNPLPTLTVTPNPVPISYQAGAPDPSGLALTLTTNGALVEYTATVSGGNWLAVSAAGGVVFPGFPAKLGINISASELAPGVYKANITIASPGAVNKSQTIPVNLTVTPAVPLISFVWPNALAAGTGDTTINLTGSGFCSSSVVRAGTTTLTKTFVGDNLMTAVIPATLLSTAGNLTLVVNNSPGGDSNASTVIINPPGPTINTVADAASSVSGAVAPGEMLVLFGTALGPDPLVSFVQPTGGAPIDITLSGVSVSFDTFAAPVIYISSTQVAVMVPYAVAGQTTTKVKLTYQGQTSNAVDLNVQATAPALFTVAGGTGQAAACNVEESSGMWSINADTAAVAKGGVLVLFGTGQGQTNPVSTDGQIPVQLTFPPYDPTISVTIGGAVAQVLYAGYSPGMVAGILEVQVRVPPAIASNKVSPVVLTVGAASSQAGVTVSVK